MLTLQDAAQMQLRGGLLCTSLEEVVMMWPHVYDDVTIGKWCPYTVGRWTNCFLNRKMWIIYIVVACGQSTRQTAGFDIQAYPFVCILILVKTSGALTFSELPLHQPRGVVALLLVSQQGATQNGFGICGRCSVCFIFCLVRPSQNSISYKNSLGKRPFKGKIVSLN